MKTLMVTALLMASIALTSFTHVITKTKQDKTTYGHTSMNNAKTPNTEKINTCFSKENFDRVYKYIDDNIKNENNIHYQYDNYELYLTSTTEISFNKDGYTLAKVAKEQGFVSLAKRKKDNDRILKEANQVFCKILSESKEKK